MENGKAFSTVRLELKTKLALMAALIYGTADGITEKDAVQAAVRIQALTDSFVDRVKKNVRHAA